MLLHPESFYDYSVEQIRHGDVRAFELAFLTKTSWADKIFPHPDIKSHPELIIKFL